MPIDPGAAFGAVSGHCQHCLYRNRPEKDIEGQLPWVFVNARNILKGETSYRKRKGEGWAQVFNDSGRSLNVKRWPSDLGSGCVYGRSLSGYVVETGQVYTVPRPKLDIEDDED